MRGLTRLTRHESCTRVVESAEAGDFQVITHKKKKTKRKCYYVSSTSESWSNDLNCQQFDKRQKIGTQCVHASTFG